MLRFVRVLGTTSSVVGRRRRAHVSRAAKMCWGRTQHLTQTSDAQAHWIFLVCSFHFSYLQNETYGRSFVSYMFSLSLSLLLVCEAMQSWVCALCGACHPLAHNVCDKQREWVSEREREREGKKQVQCYYLHVRRVDSSMYGTKLKQLLIKYSHFSMGKQNANKRIMKKQKKNKRQKHEIVNLNSFLQNSSVRANTLNTEHGSAIDAIRDSTHTHAHSGRCIECGNYGWSPCA